jgi:glycosidase
LHFLCILMLKSIKALFLTALLTVIIPNISAYNRVMPPRKNVYHIAPPHWYVGFQNPNLEIILHAENIQQFKISLAPYPGVFMDTVKPSANNDVCYIHLNIQPNTAAGILTFNIEPKEKRSKALSSYALNYELKAKRIKEQQAPGLTPNDVTYLIFPDRFCNGENDNDNENMQYRVKVDRGGLKSRHGGDLAGVKSKLDYLKELGVTALWLNPVQTNDQPEESFHGYAITDNYEIDPRFGSNKEYIELCGEMKRKGLKMVMDIIPNHVGDKHWMNQYFDTGWFNYKDTYVQTNFRAPTVADPHAAPSERALNVDGWFVPTMPDYNQKNPHIATYLDQLYLWWIEVANISGYRIDTYPYPDQNYMNHLMDVLLSEYPYLTIFGETWVNHTTTQATFVKNNIKGFEKNKLPGVTDFSMCWAFQEACSKPFGWTEGLNRVYITQSEDFLYQDPYKNCTFLDNHDISRFYSIANEDIDAWKRGITLLLTTRGLPCIYYGTEILMTGKTEKSDAYVRFDFPGGWPGDPVNKFTPKGRTSKENEAWKWMQTLNKARVSYPALGIGETTQYSGINGVYTYFRHTNNQRMMIVLSQAETTTDIAMSRFAEMTQGYTKLKNIQTGEVTLIKEKLTLSPKGSYVFELIK